MRLVIVIAVLLVSWSRPATAESQEFRVATLAPAGTPWMRLLESAAAEISTRTDGRITIKYFTGGQLGDERDYLRKIKAGQIDGAAMTALGLSMIDSSIRVLQLPMLFETQEEVDHVAGKMWPYFQSKFEAKGFRLAERGELGWIYLMSKSKVTSVADLRKQKLCMLGDDELGTSLLARLKLNGVPVSIPEVDAALSSGRIDACFNSPLGAIALQWHTKVRYMSARPLVFAIGATVMSLAAVNRVAAADRKTIDAIAKRAQKKARAVIRRANEDARKVLLRKGIQVVDVSQAMIDDLTAVGLEVQRDMIGKVFTREELDMVIAYRDAYRARSATKPAR